MACSFLRRTDHSAVLDAWCHPSASAAAKQQKRRSVLAELGTITTNVHHQQRPSADVFQRLAEKFNFIIYRCDY